MGDRKQTLLDAGYVRHSAPVAGTGMETIGWKNVSGELFIDTDAAWIDCLQAKLAKAEARVEELESALVDSDMCIHIHHLPEAALGNYWDEEGNCFELCRNFPSGTDTWWKAKNSGAIEMGKPKKPMYPFFPEAQRKERTDAE